MGAVRQKILNKFSFFGDKFRNFFYGNFYVAILSLIAILSYTADQSVLGLYAYCMFAIVILLLYDDFTPFMPLPMMVLLLCRDVTMFLDFYPYIPLFFVALALIAHFILYPAKKLKKGNLYLSLTAVSIALLCGGFFTPYLNFYLEGLPSRIATGPVLLIVYFLFLNFLNPPKDFDIAHYVCYTLTWIGLTCCCQMFLYSKELFLGEKLEHAMGWNNVNGVAALLVVCIPATFYLMTKSGRTIIYTIACALMYYGIYLTNSSGCFGVATVSIPLLYVCAYVKSTKKIKQKIFNASCICASVVIVCCAVYLHKTSSLPFLSYAKENFFSESGRTDIYLGAVNDFLKHPVFGVGIGYAPPDISDTPITSYNYHSTFFHVLATMGVVGILSYVIYFVKRYQILTAKHDAFNLFCYLSFSLMQAYGIVDTCEFNIVPLMLIVTIMITTVEFNNSCTPQLPLK